MSKPSIDLHKRISELYDECLLNIKELLRDKGIINLEENDLTSIISILVESDYGESFQFGRVQFISLDQADNILLCIDDTAYDIKSESLIITLTDLVDIYEILSVKIGEDSE